MSSSTTTCLFHRHHLHPSPYFQNDNQYIKVESFRKISDSPRFRTLNPLSSSRQNPTTTTSSSPVEKPQFESDKDENSDSGSSSTSSSNPFVLLIHGFREKVKLNELGMDIMSIALPAVIALAADPITSLV